MGEIGTVDDDLARLLELSAAHQIVNLVGPLGVGKSRLLAQLGPAVLVDMSAPGGAADLRAGLRRPGGGLVGVDGIDGPVELAEVHSALTTGLPSGVRVVLASRRPVLGRPDWADVPVASLQAREWLDEEIDALAWRSQLADEAKRGFVVRMSGGIPLIAEALCGAIHGGAPIEHPATAADVAAELIVRRLRTERPAPPWQRILRLLATIGIGDEELLDVEPDEFTALSEVSIVSRTRLGLAVREPYRTILDMSHRWRRPIDHRTALTRAGVHRIRMMSETSDAELRRDLAVHGIFLADEPYVRAMLFPPRQSLPPIAPAGPGDADDIGRLVRAWALDNEFDLRATDRLVDQWLAGTPERFHLARDLDGRAVALANLVPFGEAEAGGVEPVVQQYTERFLEPEHDDGVFVITGFWPDVANGAAMLRRILEECIDHGMAVVCTPNPEYQRLVKGLGFSSHGKTRHDVYGSGHSTHVFSQATRPGDLPGWLARLAALTGRSQPPSYLTEQLTHALERIRTPKQLARSPLLAAPHTPTVPALVEWLTKAVDTLSRSEVPVDAEAGQILLRYYLGGAGNHQLVAGRLHLSRATYFRRLAHGMAALTEWFSTAAAESSG